MAKIQVSMDDDLLARLDKYASNVYLSRSALVTLAVTSYLNSNDALLAMKDIAFAVNKIADQGTLDDETKKQLEDFERLSKMILKQ